MKQYEQPKQVLLRIRSLFISYLFTTLCFFVSFTTSIIAQTNVLPSQPPLIIDSIKYYDLESFYYLLKEEEKALNIEQVTSAKYTQQFQPIHNFPSLASDGIYWGRIIIQNNLVGDTTKSDWTFFPYDGSTTEIELYFFDQEKKNYQKKLVGEFVPLTNHDGINMFAFLNDNVVPINIPVDQTTIVYVRAKNEMRYNAPNFQGELTYATPSDINYVGEYFFYKGITLGAIFIMFIYIGVLAFILKDVTYLYYALYLFSMGIYISYTLYILPEWIFETFLTSTSPKYRFFLRLTGFFLITFYLYFIRSYTDLKQILPKWDQLFKWLIRLGYVLLPLSAVSLLIANFDPTFSNYVFIGYFLSIALFTLVFLYPLYQQRVPANNYIVLGTLVIIIGGFSIIPLLLGGAVNTSIDNFLLAVLVEIIIFTLGLSYRQKIKERESQQAKINQIEADSLRLLNTTKNRFYTNITHNFRTPLTVIQGIVQQINSHEQEKELIDRNCENLLQLIQQIMDLSKFEAGQLPVNKVNGDIIPYLRYLSESFHSYAATKNIRLHFLPKEPKLQMDYDPQLLQDIISNLLSNALKFTPTGGDIYLLSEKQNSNILLTVRDTGSGIAATALPHIFDRFYQNENGLQQQGSGIGLALTKELVMLLGGRITVESSTGIGSTFSIYLPITNVATINAPTLPLPIKLPMPDSSPKKPTPDLLHHLEVALIIEDNQGIVDFLKKSLQAHYQVLVARDGQQGVELAFEHTPDIILSDLVMPKMNGYQVCQQLKNDTRTSHIPIILLTAKSDESSKMQGLQQGADAYLTKPFKEAELKVRMEQLILIRKKIQDHFSSKKTNNNTNTAFKKAIQKEQIFIEKTRQIIEMNIDNDAFTVPILAHKLGINRSTLYKKIKALTGRSVADFIRLVRLQKANAILLESDLSISEIAYQVGFNDHAYFSKQYAEEFGYSPKETRK